MNAPHMQVLGSATLAAFETTANLSIELGEASDESQANQKLIIQHALQVIHNFNAMHRAAATMCVELYECRRRFEVSGEGGWTKFCAANFLPLKLDERRIRAAVSTGRALAQYFQAAQSKREEIQTSVLSRMSQSALLMLGESGSSFEDGGTALIERVIEIGNELGKAPTASDVSLEIDRLRIANARYEEDLAAAMKRIKDIDAVVGRMNAEIDLKSREVEELAFKLEQKTQELQRAASKPAVVVQDADPASVSSKRRAAELERDVKQLNSLVMEKKADLDRLRQEETRIRDAMANSNVGVLQKLERLEGFLSDCVDLATSSLKGAAAIDDRAVKQRLGRCRDHVKVIASIID